MRKLVRHISVIVLLIAGCMSAQAQAQAPRAADIVSATVRHGWKTDAGTYMIAVHLRMTPDWITYWRHPGESGIAPSLDWTTSVNLANVQVHWPEPRLFVKSGYYSIGFADELVLPLELTPADPSRPINFEAKMNIGVCNDICIPVDLRLSAQVNGAGQRDSMIINALAERPRLAQGAGLTGVSCELHPDKRGYRLAVRMNWPASGADEFMLVELPAYNGRKRVLRSQRSGDTLTGFAHLRGTSDRTMFLDRSDVRINLVTANGTFSHQGCALTSR